MSAATGTASVAPGGVLVVGPAWVGDMVMAQSMLQLLRRRAPEQPIDMLAPAWSHGLIARMPEVREALRLDAGHGELALLARLRLGHALRARRYARAIVLPRAWKAALVPFAAGIPLRTGQAGEFRYGLVNDVRRFSRDAHRRTATRFASLATPRGETAPTGADIPFPQLRVDVANRERLLRELALATDRPVIGIAPGAEYGASKRWPAEHYRELAGRLVAEGHAVWAFGSAKDAAAATAAAPPQAGPHYVNLCGRTELADVVDLVSLTAGVVANDSGLMHLAAATGRRTVGLFGSTSPEHTPPRAAQARVLTLRLACSPCFARECPLGHHACLRELAAGTVHAALFGP